MKIFKALVAILSCVANLAYAESRVGNGGDSIAAEFVEMADDTLLQLAKLKGFGEQLPLSADQYKGLASAIGSIVVFTQERAVLTNGAEVDAINYPIERKIVLSRARWSGLVYNLKSLKTIVLHEYLTLAGVDDKSYQVSTKLVRKIFNNGSASELWYLKDIDDKRFTNPFLSPWLEIDGKKLVSSSRGFGDGVINFQSGRVVQKVVAGLPSCSMELAQASLPGAVIKAYILNAKELSDTAVELDLGKPAIIKRIVCTSGSVVAKPTVENMLDSLDNLSIVFNHQNNPTCSQ